MDKAIAELIKKVSTRLIMKKGLTHKLGVSGNIGIKMRRNILLKVLLKQRVPTQGMVLNTISINEIREKTLAYIENMRVKKRPYGQYRYSAIHSEPVLYASIYAILTRHIYRDTDRISQEKRKEWINYIQLHQTDVGLFKDPLVENRLANIADWWGWRHLTLHAIMALMALGVVAEKKFRFLEKFKDRRFLMEWLRSRNWKENPANVSNEIQNYGTLLQYARDFQGERWAEGAVKNLFDGLDKIQDTRTGLWGNRFDTATLLSNGVQAGYHIWLLYFYDRRPVRYEADIIDSCLATQNELGGFGVALNSSACEDIDSIDPLARFYFVTSHRKSEVELAMKHALIWILGNMNSDGGFVFRMFEPFLYGHERMFSGINQNAMFPTWFRTLSLAYIGKVLPDSLAGRVDWQFINCPGHQFWRN